MTPAQGKDPCATADTFDRPTELETRSRVAMLWAATWTVTTGAASPSSASAAGVVSARAT
jgi:hypothetical protein